MKTYKEFINETNSMSHEYVLGSLADKDINAHVKNNKIVVDKSEVARARAHLKKIGHDHIKVTHVGSGQVAEEFQLDETLDPSKGAGEYIKDFEKSDAPQFKGKSKEKRRTMGIAAYLDAKRNK